MTYDELEKLAIAEYEHDESYKYDSVVYTDHYLRDLVLKYVRSYAIETLTRYRTGWDMDNTYWIMADNTVVSTSHGRVVIENTDWFLEYVTSMNKHVDVINSVVERLKF